MISRKDKEKIQKDMFACAYKHNANLSNEERFLRAIVLSSDESVDDAVRRNPEGIQEYLMYLLEGEACKMNEKFDRKSRESDMA